MEDRLNQTVDKTNEVLKELQLARTDQSQIILGDLNEKHLGNLNRTKEFSGRWSSIFQISNLNSLAALMPSFRSFLNLGFDDKSKHTTRKG